MAEAFYQDFKLGVLGGGQLGRMLVQSAIDFNIDVAIMDGDPNAPCSRLTSDFVHGSLTDFEAVYNFGKECDLVTIEIENVNTAALKKLESEGIKVFPQPHIIELIKDKVDQKKFYAENGIPTSEFIEVHSAKEAKGHVDFLPFVNKLATEGYDGRGVQIVRSESDLNKCFDRHGLIEKLIDFETEISVMVARNENGNVMSYPAVELMFHPEQNLVEYLFAPASISENLEIKAQNLAKEVIEKLQMVGLLAVEMFVTKDDDILVNEVAPRTHNSGHQTIEANITSQFEQHLRSILGMPLGATDLISPAAMINLLGEDGFTGPAKYQGLEQILSNSDIHVHLYGKKTTKPFRKMGHVTVLDKDKDKLKSKAEFVKSTLKIVS